MENITHLTPQQRADLVAYLDGELDEEVTRQIEQTLAASPIARHEVEMLTRTWEILDVLPRAQPVSEEFTLKTISNIRVTKFLRPLSERLWFQHARRGAIVAGWATALALSAVIGFFTANRWIPVESDQLIEYYPVIENLEIYSEVNDVEFLKALQGSDLFHEVPDEKQ